MEQIQKKEYWLVWYPSYTHKDFELKNDNIEDDLTDSYLNNTNQLIHTYLIVKPYSVNVALNNAENTNATKENIQLSFYKIVHKKSKWVQFKFYLFRNGILKNRPLTMPVKNVSSQLKESNLVAEINLIYKQHSSNGLFVYECQADEKSKKFLSGQESLAKDKYQYSTFYCIKQLYHTHLFHKKSKYDKYYKDYHFRALPVDEEPNVTTINNKSIKYYLSEIKNYFDDQLKHFEDIKTCDTKGLKQIDKDIETLSEFLSKITESDEQTIELKKILEGVKDKRSKAKDKLINLLKEKKDKRNLYLTIHDIVGETLFTNALCYSKYLDKNKDDEVRKLLLNIENLKTGLYYIRDTYRYWYGRQESKKSLFWSKIGVSIGYLGYLAGMVGIALAFYFYFSSNLSTKSEIESAKIETTKELKNHIDSCFVNLQQHLSSQP